MMSIRAYLASGKLKSAGRPTTILTSSCQCHPTQMIFSAITLMDRRRKRALLTFSVPSPMQGGLQQSDLTINQEATATAGLNQQPVSQTRNCFYFSSLRLFIFVRVVVIENGPPEQSSFGVFVLSPSAPPFNVPVTVKYFFNGVEVGSVVPNLDDAPTVNANTWGSYQGLDILDFTFNTDPSSYAQVMVP